MGQTSIKSLWHDTKELWAHRDQLREGSQQREELAFYPAALEIQESPPNPLGRKFTWVLLSLFTIGLIWACIGEVDIVAVADGKIIPTSKTKEIQPLEKGVVGHIYVKEGQLVEAGDPLVHLDQTLTQANRQRLRQELKTSKLSHARLQLFQQWLEQPATVNFPMVSEKLLSEELKHFLEVKQDDLNLQSQILRQQWQAFLAQVDGVKQKQSKVEAQWQGSKERLIKLEKTIPLIKKRADAIETLWLRDLAPEVDHLKLRQEMIEAEQDYATEQAMANQMTAQLAELNEKLNQIRAETAAKYLQQQQELLARSESLTEELNKADELHRKQVLAAPVAGMVQELAVHTIGGVVTPAQILMKIVPKEDKLAVETILENKDIGFVHEGQDAEIKIHTFPFTKYGTIDAQVINLYDDAVADEQKGLVFKMSLKMASHTMMVDGKKIELKPGMSVTAEVKTSKRRLIEFFLAPLLRYSNESIRER